MSFRSSYKLCSLRTAPRLSLMQWVERTLSVPAFFNREYLQFNRDEC